MQSICSGQSLSRFCSAYLPEMTLRHTSHHLWFLNPSVLLPKQASLLTHLVANLQLLVTLAVILLQALLVLTQLRSRKSHLQVQTQPRSRKSRLQMVTQPRSRKSPLLVLTQPVNSKSHLQTLHMRFHLKVF